MPIKTTVNSKNSTFFVPVRMRNDKGFRTGEEDYMVLTEK
jgi:hypothetical protein